jgi:hypothetical protein
MGVYKAVAFGAQLLCSAGSCPSVLLPTTAPTVVIEGKTLATIMDFSPIKNIPPFGTCSLQGGKPCLPVLPTPWTDTLLGDIHTVNAPVLPVNSTLQCAIGGLIHVNDCNQASLSVGVYDPDRPRLSEGPTPEEQRAEHEREEWLRTHFPEVADYRYGKEPSPEELESRVMSWRAEEEAAKRALDSTRKAVGGYAQARREAQEAYDRAKAAREEAEWRLTRANNRRGVEEVRRRGRRR